MSFSARRKFDKYLELLSSHLLKIFLNLKEIQKPKTIKLKIPWYNEIRIQQCPWIEATHHFFQNINCIYNTVLSEIYRCSLPSDYSFKIYQS